MTHDEKTLIMFCISLAKGTEKLTTRQETKVNDILIALEKGEL